MNDTIELPHTHVLDGGATITSYIEDDGWLSACTITGTDGTTTLHVKRSAWMQNDDLSYRPVLALIEKLGAQLIGQEIYRDADWIHRKCESLTFKVLDPYEVS